MYIRIDDHGAVTAHPACVDLAATLIRKHGLPGLTITYQSIRSRSHDTKVDLGLLKALPSLRSLEISPLVHQEQLLNFDAIHSLSKLTDISTHEHPALDLSAFPALEHLSLSGDIPHRGFETLQRLRHLSLLGLPRGDLSFLAGAKQLACVWLSEVDGEALVGLDTLTGLTQLQLSDCADLTCIDPLPPNLRDLNVQKSPRFSAYGFLAGNASLEELFAFTSVDTLAFVPSMPKLERLIVGTVIDGDLSPLLESESLRSIQVRPFRRRYSHTQAQLCEALGLEWRLSENGVTREQEKTSS